MECSFENPTRNFSTNERKHFGQSSKTTKDKKEFFEKKRENFPQFFTKDR